MSRSAVDHSASPTSATDRAKNGALDRCPGCGTPTVPRRTVDGHVHVSYCLPCTEAELGETYEQIRDRATSRVQGVAKKKWRVTS